MTIETVISINIGTSFSYEEDNGFAELAIISKLSKQPRRHFVSWRMKKLAVAGPGCFRENKPIQS